MKKRGLIMGVDITKVDEEYTTATMCKVKNENIIVLETLRIKPNDPDWKRKITNLYLKWHPNIMRRWLFRLLGV